MWLNRLQDKVQYCLSANANVNIKNSLNKNLVRIKIRISSKNHYFYILDSWKTEIVNFLLVINFTTKWDVDLFTL